MLVHWGSGSNGKNTLLKALRLAMGPYAMAGTAGLLTVDKEAAMIHEIADLYGSRLVTIDETSDGARLNESSFKRVTGDDNVRGRHLYKSFFEYRPTYKLHLLTNHKPRVVNTDNGVWRRLRLLPYTQAFTADNGRIDKGLDETLENEMHGILAWLVAGAARWHTGGLKMCPEVAEASAAYRSEEDMLGQFLGERCVVGPEFETPVAALYSSYSAWARDNGAFVMSKKRLVGDILERPIAVQRVLTGGTKNIVTLRGFKLLAV
jgi:putative DNA primase/helicase